MNKEDFSFGDYDVSRENMVKLIECVETLYEEVAKLKNEIEWLKFNA